MATSCSHGHTQASRDQLVAHGARRGRAELGLGDTLAAQLLDLHPAMELELGGEIGFFSPARKQEPEPAE
jgi:hypothetical protein